MAFYTILTPYLDECGSVYVAGAGDNGSAVRLNDRASELWRELVATGGGGVEAMAEQDRAFVRALVARRVIASSGDTASPPNPDHAGHPGHDGG